MRKPRARGFDVDVHVASWIDNDGFARPRTREQERRLRQAVVKNTLIHVEFSRLRES